MSRVINIEVNSTVYPFNECEFFTFVRVHNTPVLQKVKGYAYRNIGVYKQHKLWNVIDIPTGLGINFYPGSTMKGVVNEVLGDRVLMGIFTFYTTTDSYRIHQERLLDKIREYRKNEIKEV